MKLKIKFMIIIYTIIASVICYNNYLSGYLKSKLESIIYVGMVFTAIVTHNIIRIDTGEIKI